MALAANMGSNLQAKFGYIQSYTAGGAIWRGGLVVLRLATAGDKVYAAVDDPTDALKQLVLGFAMEAAKVANVTIRVRQDGKYRLKFPSIPALVIGHLACIATPAAGVTDDWVQLWGTDTCKVVVGRITEKTPLTNATHVFVNLGDRPARLATEFG